MKKRVSNHNKSSVRAVSVVLGSVLMIAATLAVGFAAWSWASSTAVNSENVYGKSVASNISYLNELFTISNANFSSIASQNVSVWIYNSGNLPVNIKQIWISNTTAVSGEQWSNTTTKLSNTNIPNCGHCLTVPPGTVKSIMLKVSTPFKSGVLYQFKILGQYGNTYSYEQTK